MEFEEIQKQIVESGNILVFSDKSFSYSVVEKLYADSSFVYFNLDITDPIGSLVSVIGQMRGENVSGLQAISELRPLDFNFSDKTMNFFVFSNLDSFLKVNAVMFEDIFRTFVNLATWYNNNDVPTRIFLLK